MKPDQRVLRCLEMLGAPQFIPLMEYWQQSRQEALEALVSAADSTRVCRLQGRAETLGELIKGIEDAPQRLKTLNNPGQDTARTYPGF